MLRLLTLLLVMTSPYALASKQQTASDFTAGEFDYYLLALSWSPSFCLIKPEDSQCSGKGYGFVLHGLWPQFTKGGWPQFCAPRAPLSEAQKAAGLQLYPTLKLVEHEWDKHGTCTGLGVEGYWQVSDKAVATVKIPAELEPSSEAKRLSAQQIKTLFLQSNPKLTENSLGVYCRKGRLDEVRICLSKDLSPISCGEALKGACNQSDLLVPPVR